jgi:DNA-binding response OmpR family regulator
MRGQAVPLPELLARVTAAVRRRIGRRRGPIRVGELVIHPVTEAGSSGGRQVELANKEFS